MTDYTSEYVGFDLLDVEGGFINPNLALLQEKFMDHDTFVLQGGTRSGKTYSTILFFLGNMIAMSGVKYAIIRQSMPVLKATVIPDFIEIANKLGIYDDRNYNKSDYIFSYNGNSLHFVSAEDEGKMRGLKSDVLYINEAPELDWEPVRQLLMRNSSKAIFDYNPSYDESWLYDNIMTREGVAFLKTTYNDNPFVTQKQIDELNFMKENDPEGYSVYGLGERAETQGGVYGNFMKIADDLFPKDADVFCVDFGWHPDPTAMTRKKYIGREIYVKELLYMHKIGTLEILITLFDNGYVDGHHVLIADSADPQAISSLRHGIKDISPSTVIEALKTLGLLELHHNNIDRIMDFALAGVTVYGSLRGQGTIKSGIREVKKHVIKATSSSENLWDEYRKYMYKKDRNTGRFTGEPIDKNNHLLDCIRMSSLAKGRYFNIN